MGDFSASNSPLHFMPTKTNKIHAATINTLTDLFEIFPVVSARIADIPDFTKVEVDMSTFDFQADSVYCVVCKEATKKAPCFERAFHLSRLSCIYVHWYFQEVHMIHTVASMHYWFPVEADHADFATCPMPNIYICNSVNNFF
jgi:hypothetical protein